MIEGPNQPSRRRFIGALAGMALSLPGLAQAQTKEVQKPRDKNTDTFEILKELKLKAFRLKMYLESPKIKSLRESIKKKIKPTSLSLPAELDYILDTESLEGKEKECIRLQESLSEPGLSTDHRNGINGMLERYRKEIIDEYTRMGNIFDKLINKRDVEKNALRRKNKPKIYGFQKNEEVGDLISMLPEKLWNDVARVNSGDNTSDMAVSQELGSGFGEALVAPQSRKVVTLPSSIEKNTRQEILELLVHEFAHFSDWSKSINLTIEERLKFYNEMLDIFLDSKRSHDWYVDDWIPKEYKEVDDIQIDLKVRESWAQLVSRFFMEKTTGEPGTSSARLTEKEIKFTQKWLSKNGIDFK